MYLKAFNIIYCRHEAPVIEHVSSRVTWMPFSMAIRTGSEKSGG